MTENRAEVEKNEISPVIEEYNRWNDVDGVSTLGQALHYVVINSLPWGEDTLKKVAEFVLSKDRQEVLDWIDDRKGLYHLENDHKHEKVHEVMKE